MSIMDTLFGRKGQQEQQQLQQQQQQQNAQQGQPQQQPNPHIQGNPTIPNGTNTPQNNGTPTNPQGESPLAGMADLWKNTTEPGNANPNFILNPEHLGQVVSKQDFLKSINQEDLAKIAAGGQDAVAALSNVLNTFGREVFSRSAQFSSHMTDSGFRVAQQALDRTVPEVIRRQAVTHDMYEKYPKLRDPALQPMIAAITNQFAEKYPNSTKSEINEMAAQYVEQFASAFKTEEPAGKAQQSNAAADFSSFLN